ncbi:MAG: Na+/H+ antiporter NhaA [Coxiellaceae bacterium]|nr:Na+/H+ antiporter NhaA [Coxiellaceae bacterium]
MPVRTLREFIKLESSGGVVLFLAAILALILDNSGWSIYYHAIFNQTFSIRLGDFELAKPVLLWVNDGLMVFFFLLVGLEIKRELFEGELNTKAKAVLPAIAAAGGMVVPAVIYIALNHGHGDNLRGWAIPTATDIAFSLGILALLKSRIPPSLKIFLTALAIFDDIGAIVIIAIFYTNHISLALLLVAAGLTVVLVLFNRFHVTHRAAYFIIALIMWVCVLKSGVHATLVGIIVGFAIPLRVPTKDGGSVSPVRELEHSLHPWVAFLILPLFAFANAGISFKGMSWDMLLHPIPLGITLGLFFGKQFGIFIFTWVAIKLKWARIPHNSNWLGIYGMSMIAGVGFTMSLFIGSLAFASMEHMAFVRMGVLLGSLLSGVAGYLLLRLGNPRRETFTY